MSSCCVDHITVAVHSLAAGTEWLNQLLGVSMEPGGKHPRMGTHNSLLRLGDRQFLEVIAIDPTASPPPIAGRRWFRLDELDAVNQPMRLAWVARTDDLDSLLVAASEPLGIPERLSRGALHWRMALRSDGGMPLDDTGPMMIQWERADHPAMLLEDQSCSLTRLTLLHPQPARLEQFLSSIRFTEPVTLVEAAHAQVRVQLRCPQGLREIALPSWKS